MGVDAETLFEGRARSGGNECYRTVEPDSIEARYCTEVLYVWAVGGKPTFFPDHVGLPMSIQNGTEYFLMETHYDNPNRLANLRVSVTLQTYYTSQLRKHDAGLLWVGHWTPGLPSLLIPPNSLSHVTMGHCAPGCTQRFLEKEVNIFAAYLHTHLAGRGVRALHFRGNKELPWIISDDNYNFDYQQTRILRQERKLVPGDQLMIRCTYETTNSNGSVVEGGFSTRQEMCAMGLLYYNRVPNFTFCLSEIKTEAYHNFLGVRNVTWDGSIKDMVITDPPRFSGLTMKTYADNHIEWDIRMRTEIQRYHKSEPQTVNCASALPIESIDSQNNQEIVDDNDDDDNEVGRRILRYSGDGGISLALRNVASQRRQSFQDKFDRRGSNNVGSDDDGGGDEHLSALPQGVARYRRPTQCQRATISSRRSG
ncbi:unnamed protein product [Orchesella dallaii]|uniref:DBH-like monooxygenase protein 1 n=1 Tax=Orchesella dallaii TaxID=48710 RepID=A0ABP1RB90_9HEXA